MRWWSQSSASTTTAPLLEHAFAIARSSRAPICPAPSTSPVAARRHRLSSPNAAAPPEPANPSVILNDNQNSPVMCAQEQANHSFVQEQNVRSNVSAHEPAAYEDGYLEVSSMSLEHEHSLSHRCS